MHRKRGRTSHALHNSSPVRRGLGLIQSRLCLQSGQTNAGGHLRLPLPRHPHLLRTGKALAEPLERKAIAHGFITDHQVDAAALALLSVDAFAATYDTEIIQHDAHQSAGIYGRPHYHVSRNNPLNKIHIWYYN